MTDGAASQVKEAFKVYDPHDTGFVDMEILKGIFVNLGFGDMSHDDVQASRCLHTHIHTLPSPKVGFRYGGYVEQNAGECRMGAACCGVAVTFVIFPTCCLPILLPQVLVETADVDNDGKISLSDFRKMVTHSKTAEGDLDSLHKSVGNK